MPREANYDRASLQSLLDKQYAVVARGQALSCELSNRVLQHRLRPGGPWRLLLPGVYLTVTGTPTPAQREMAALLYAGPASVITGPAALVSHGVQVPPTDLVDVLVPTTTQRKDQRYVRLHRTARLPRQALPSQALPSQALPSQALPSQALPSQALPSQALPRQALPSQALPSQALPSQALPSQALPSQVLVRNEIRYAPAARAVADTARIMDGLDEIRAVVADALQRGACTLGQLTDEVSEGPIRGSALLRQAVADVAGESPNPRG
jgi:hypothetical protein